MIVDRTDGKLVDALLFAHEIKDDSLFEILKRYSGDDKEIILYNDFVEHSFEFVFNVNGNRQYNGGIIYHGGAEETFSVQMTPTINKMWSVHT